MTFIREYDEDPFDDVDTPDHASGELEDLIHRMNMPSEERCSVSEYIDLDGENSLSVCFEQDDERWEEQFLASIHAEAEQSALDSKEPEEEMFDLEPPPPKIKNLSEAIHSLEDTQAFLDSGGYNDHATIIASAVDSVISLHCSSLACFCYVDRAVF